MNSMSKKILQNFPKHHRLLIAQEVVQPLCLELQYLNISEQYHFLPLEYLDADEFYSVLVRKCFIAIQEAKRANITDNKLLGWFLSIFTNGRFLFGLHSFEFSYFHFHP